MSHCISVQDLHKTFLHGFFRKKIQVLKGVSFDVQAGEIFGFLGPNGSGKTTTIKILLGLIFPSAGTAQIFGRSIKDVDFKKEIGFLPDSPYFYHYLSGEEFLRFYGHLFGLRHAALDRKIDELLELVDMRQARKLQLRKYSRGMLQRIGMAQALINDPKLVIMDEPMEGLDPVGRKHFRDIMIRLREQGKTVFFSTHILSDVEMICDRVAIMVQGKIRGLGLLQDLLKTKVQSVDICFRKPPETLLRAIEKQNGKIVLQGEQALVQVDEAQVNVLLGHLMKEGLQVYSVIPHKESLERIFMNEVAL